MKPLELTVRCMVRREGDLWVAVCIDFSLAAQADTREEAQRKLHAQIDNYVRDALTVHAAHAEALLSRKGPLRHRLLFRICRYLDDLRRSQRNVYTEALPMQPAAA